MKLFVYNLSFFVYISGFPKRVLPSDNSEESSKEPVETEPEEELLKFEDDGGQNQGSPEIVTTNNKLTASEANDYDSKMRYEFSETRKVLDEFFHKDITPEDVTNAMSTASDFSDLNYVLRKNNNYVGQRLAASEATEIDPNEISPELETTQQQHVISNTNDLLLTSPTPLKDEPPNTLTVASNLRPQLGVSPLDQPLVNFSNVVHQEQVCYEFECLVESCLSSERVTHP